FELALVSKRAGNSDWRAIAMRSVSACSCIVTLLLLCSGCGGHADPPITTKTDRELIQGKWRVDSGEIGGKPLPEEDKKKGDITFDGDQVIFMEVPFPG